MNQPVLINAFMFHLLIEQGMNNFSVVEVRDALMEYSDQFSCTNEARKYAYRQILSFEEKGWLMHSGTGQRKRYLKTNVFLQKSFNPRPFKKSFSIKSKEVNIEASFPLTILKLEKKQYEGELAITLGEIEEYQSLIERFPQQRDFFLPLFTEAKDRSAKQLGRLNALSKVLTTSGEEMTIL